MKGNLKMKGILIATALLLVIALAGSASATVSSLQWSDGDDYVAFCNETVTFTWVDDTNTTNYWGLSNVSNGSHIIRSGEVSGSYNSDTGNYEFEYKLTNYSGIYNTLNDSTTLVFAVNASNSVLNTDNTPLKQQFPMNNYTVNIMANDLLAGTVKDDIFLKVNTSGASLAEDRANAFSLNGITTNSSGTSFTLNMDNSTGNGTVNATIGDSTGYYWVNVSTGGAERVSYINVTDLDTQTTNVRAGVSDNQSFAYLNLTGGFSKVDYPVLVNFSVDTDLRPDDRLLDNATKTDETKINVTLLSGHNNWTQDADSYAYGNYTNPINISGTGSSTGSGQLVIDTNVTGDKQWTVDYSVVSETTNITGEVSPTWAHIGDNISVTSWYYGSGDIAANVSYTNTSGAKVYVTNITIVPDSTYGTNTTTWDTNATWQDWFPNNRTLNKNPENFTVNITDVSGNSTIKYVELFDYIKTSTNVTDWIAINKTFNMTVNSSMRNATVINFNMTSTNTSGKTIVVNDTLSGTISNYNATTKNSSVTLSYNTSTNYTELASTAANGYWGTNGVGTKTLMILANDTAWSDTTTVTLKDEIIIDSCPSAAVPGQTIKIKGKVLRQAGTVINATITGTNYDTTIGTTTSSYNSTTGYSNFTLNWSATTSGEDDLQEGTYQLYVNDTFVKTSIRTVDLQAGELSYTVSPDPAGIDETVWFNGTTTLAEDTVLTANVTKNGQIINNATNTSTVESDGTFSISWLPSVNTTDIRTVGFTQPETTYQVNVSNATNGVYMTKTFNLSDTLAVNDVTIATGDMYNVTGTTTRENGTSIMVNVTGFNVDHDATTTAWNGQFNQTFYATVHNSSGGTKLSAGDYTIEVNDSITTATATLSVQTPYITITSPTAGQEIGVGTNVSVTGDTNRGDGRDVDVTITGPNYASGTQTVQVQDKSFTYYWNTTGLEDQLGTYYITVETTVDSNIYTDQISVELVGPANVTLESFTAPSSVAVDESFMLNATVTNTGGVAGDITVDFKKENASTGVMEIFDTKTVSDVGAGETVYVESNSTSYAAADDYNVTVNDKDNKTVTVQAANVFVDSFAVDPSTTVSTGESFVLNATVKNTGGAAGDMTVDFKKENASTGAMEIFDTKTVSDVGAGETVYVESNSTSYASAADYNVTVNDLDTKMVTVEEEVVTSPPVKINEFVPGPETLNYLTDYIELYNPTDSAVDLTGWTIASPPSDVDVYSLDGKSIPANGYLVLEGGGADFSFNLAYDGDIIELKNGTTLVDDVAYGTAGNAPAPGEDNSTARDPDGVDTDNDGDDFRVFTNVTLGESNTPGVECTENEQLIQSYYTEYDCAGDLTQDDVVQAVTVAVGDYFDTDDEAQKQAIVDDVAQMVSIYFNL